MVQQKKTRTKKCLPVPVQGEGIWDTIKETASKVSNKVTNFFKPNLSGYNNISKKTINEYGNIPITRIVASRTPVVYALDKVISLVSAGKWDELKKKYGYEKFFHLCLVCYLENGKMVVVEKNETIDITTKWAHNSETETFDVKMGDKANKLTINEMLTKCREKFTDDKSYFGYDAFGNSNCQNFALDCLEQSGISDAETKKFIFQDVSELVKELPSYTKAITKGVTDLGAWFAKITGKGRSHHGWRIQHIVVHKPISRDRAIALVLNIAKKYDKITEKENAYHFQIEPKEHFSRFRGKKMNDKLSLFFGKPKMRGGKHKSGVMDADAMLYDPFSDEPFKPDFEKLFPENKMVAKGAGVNIEKAQETALRMRGTGATDEGEKWVFVKNPYFKGQTIFIQNKNIKDYIEYQKRKYEDKFKNQGYIDFDKMEGSPKEKAKIQFDFFDDQRQTYENSLKKIEKDRAEEKAKDEPNQERLKKMDNAETKIKQLLNETNEVLRDTKMLMGGKKN
mgnify:CR=1 FL=1